MQTLRITVLSAILLAVIGCSGSKEQTDPIQCTTEAVPGLAISIVDMDTNDNLICDSFITIEEGEFSESYFMHGEDCNGVTAVFGVFERAGVYKVTTERPGYKTSEIENIEVKAGQCHVSTNQLNVEMERGYDFGKLQQELADNQAKWQAAEKLEYQFDLNVFCNCIEGFGDFFAKIEPNKSTFFDEYNEKFLTEDDLTDSRIGDIEQLFNLVEQSIGQVDMVEVDYHADLGYPVAIKIDQNFSMADDEYSIEVSNFFPEQQGIICTEQLVWGLTLKVLDENQNNISCAVEAVLAEGDYSEQMYASDSCQESSVLHGAAERMGSYNLMINHPDFQSSSIENIDVMADLCHVRTKHLELVLKPKE